MLSADDEDAAWMLQVAAGDRAAFARLFDRHQARVVRFCQRFVGDAPRAEELAQDVFIKLYKSAGRYQRTARFQTFLFRVATNTCLNELRRPGRGRRRWRRRWTTTRRGSSSAPRTTRRRIRCSRAKTSSGR